MKKVDAVMSLATNLIAELAGIPARSITRVTFAPGPSGNEVVVEHMDGFGNHNMATAYWRYIQVPAVDLGDDEPPAKRSDDRPDGHDGTGPVAG